jgi:hypothetical protein
MAPKKKEKEPEETLTRIAIVSGDRWAQVYPPVHHLQLYCDP